MSDAARTLSKYDSNSAFAGEVLANSAANSESAATTMKVAPNKVSGRVVYIEIGSARPSISKVTFAPVDLPIQLRCINKTLSGHLPSSCCMSSSKRSA